MMRRILAGCTVVLATLISLGVTELAQAQLFDQEKSRQEIETMRGILRTSLDYALKRNPQASEDSKFGDLTGFNRPSRITGFYLYGQGALFAISLASSSSAAFTSMAALAEPIPPAPPLPPAAPAPPPAPSLLNEDDLAAARQEAEAAQADVAAAAAQAKQQQKEAARQMEEIMKQTAKVQRKMGEWKKQTAEAHARLQEQIATARLALVETLAKYGDSLTVVKPQEYITIVISGEAGPWFSDEFLVGGPVTADRNQQIVSVQKSVVTDYKAGRITLDEFKKKVLSYTE